MASRGDNSVCFKNLGINGFLDASSPDGVLLQGFKVIFDGLLVHIVVWCSFHGEE